MANYTIEIYKLYEDKHFNLFDFNYPFYCDDEKIKKEFEDKFVNHYYFREIGQETVSRFKHELKNLLCIRMPYYKKLYETELVCKDINFMLNKDLKEEFITEYENQNNSSSSSNGNSTSSTNNENDSRFFDSPQQKINDLEKFFTTATKDKENGSSISNINNNSNSNSNNSGRQKQTNLSQGNIGITSSAELLQKWRDVLINIDEMIIKECDCLFMQIF